MAQANSYRWWVVAMLWFVCFFNYADRQAIFSVFPVLKAEMNLSDVQLGIVAACFMWVYALVGPMGGWLGDRFSRKTLILGGLAFWSLITASTALAHTYPVLIACRTLGGLGEALYFPAAMSMLSDYHGMATRSRAMAIHQSSVYAGSIAGGTLSGFIAEAHGWRASFVVLGALGVVLSLILIALLREPVRGQSSEQTPAAPAGNAGSGDFVRSMVGILRNRMVLLLMSVFIGANFVAVIFLTWMPSFLFTKYHLSLSMSGLNATLYMQIASVLGVLTGGLLADSLIKRSRGGRMWTQALGLICGVPFLFLAGWTTALPVLILSMVGMGYFKGLYDANIFASLHDVVPVEHRAIATGLMNSIGWLGGGLAPVAIARAAESFGMSACISATALIYLSLGLLLAIGVWRLDRSPRMCIVDHEN